MTPYQEFIAKSRYSRYIPEENRREDWPETTRRWIGFFQEHLRNRLRGDDHIWSVLDSSITDLEVLPSMRSIMTAGEALRRSNVAAYNCAYTVLDDIRAFDEAMYILLCGTGVGFSAEKKYVECLPTIPGNMTPVDYVIHVEDSKEGWCYAYQELLYNLWQGIIPHWDVSRVRPAGAPLKTFGGRASGPGPLTDLFYYTIHKFVGAKGRKLHPIEAHDIMCKIGEVVVVGGVRRSAMISLGDLGDYEHANAKAGNWWELHPERALSNNSAVYDSTPTMGEFMREWSGIHASGSGERGIFNREASQKQAAKWGRRSNDLDYGTNPCSEIILRPNQFCNLSTVVVRSDDTPSRLEDKVMMASIMGTMQATLTDFPYLRDIWRKNTEEERLLGVSMTGILGNNYLIEAGSHGLLRHLRDVARSTNKSWSEALGIQESAAITCVKPEGTVSQLTMTKSGIHAGHAPYYIRRVRQDKKDPLTQFLIKAGVPHEDCVMKGDTTVVFSFPQKSEGINRNDITAIEHLELWLKFQRNWCEHKPSVTISIKEDEWMDVGAWVYRHFDECTGVSFLPQDGGTYQQAPYEDCTEEEYNRMVAAMPIIDWSQFREYTDNVEGAQTLACVAGVCSI